MISGINVEERPRLRAFLAWWALWTIVALLFSVHFRLYYDATWGTALRWGVVDWYVWGFLSLSLWPLCRHVRIHPADWIRPLAIHFVLMIILSALHVALVILVDRLIHPDSLHFWSHFRNLFTKKMTLNGLTYWALVATFHAITDARVEEDEDETKSERDFVPGFEETACEHLLVKEGDREYFLPVAEITFVETAGNYLSVHTRAQSWLIRRTLKELESQLDPRRFLRISRFVLVNLERVVEIRREFKGTYEVVLEGDTSRRLTRKYRRNLQKKLGSLF